MKKLIFTLACLILTSCASTKLPPAPASENMMEQADQVIIVTNDKAKYSYKNFSQYLIKKGFQIKQANESFYTLETGNQFLEKDTGWRIYYRINASIIDSTVNLSAVVAYPLGNQKPARNENGFSDEQELAWKHLVRLAKNYPEAEQILYKRN